MAVTEFGVNHALAVKLWSKKLDADVLLESEIADYIGTDDNSMVQIKTETQKSAGDQVTFGIRMLLSGPGVQGDDTQEGNEEALTTYTDAVLINQLRHATRSKGKMSEQRVPFSVREHGRTALKDWWTDRIAVSLFNQLCGNSVQTDTRYSGNNAIVAPSATRRLFGGNATTADENIDSGDTIAIADIDRFIESVSTLQPRTRPISLPKTVNGYKGMYVLFVHPYQAYTLRRGAVDAGTWFDIQKAAMTGGEITKNPIFTGALGMYNNVLIKVDSRVPLGVNSSTGAAISTVRRAVFCGAQSAVMGFGQDGGPGRFSWVEKLFDYDNQLGVTAGTIFGIKKTVYNSVDFGTVVLSTYAAAH